MQEWNAIFAFKWSFRVLLLSGDEHSRALPGKQPGKGSGQSIPDQKFDFKFRLIAFFLLVLQVCLAMEDEGRHI
ncbi:hypothetical protein ACFX19_036071 [Malus domestica]